MMRLSKTQLRYIAWQTRALHFYLAARFLWQASENSLLTPFAFCAFQSIENLLKATAFYHYPEFNPKEYGHDVWRLLARLRELGLRTDGIKIPSHWARWQSDARYPVHGVGFGGLDKARLDTIFADLVSLVPFQHFNSELSRLVLQEGHGAKRQFLEANNRELERMRDFVHRNLAGPREVG